MEIRILDNTSQATLVSSSNGKKNSQPARVDNLVPNPQNYIILNVEGELYQTIRVMWNNHANETGLGIINRRDLSWLGESQFRIHYSAVRWCGGV